MPPSRVPELRGPASAWATSRRASPDSHHQRAPLRSPPRERERPLLTFMVTTLAGFSSPKGDRTARVQVGTFLMSALGQKRTFANDFRMSALGRKGTSLTHQPGNDPPLAWT